MPNRCLVARSRRRAWWRSPSNDSTVSTTCSSTRGPASAPSLVTWPTSTVARSRLLASRTSRAAHSRTWATDPGAEPSSGSKTVWMESTTTRSGCDLVDLGDQVAAGPSRWPASSRGARVPSRSARRRTCWGDSSADDVERRWPPTWPPPTATWSSSVDLPMPGSPPTRVTEPGTRPPLSTRSTSREPVERGPPLGRRRPRRSARPDRPSPRAHDRRRRRPSSSSTRVFHSPHDGQRPTHLGLGPPHSWQRNTDRTFDMTRP